MNDLLKNKTWFCLIFILAFTGVMSELKAQKLSLRTARTISFQTTEGSFMDVDLSPDGKELLFCMLGDLYQVPVKGGNATQITKGLAYSKRPVWSPDEKRIAYLSDATGDWKLHVWDVRTHQIVQTLSGKFSNDQFTDWKLSWSEDGNFLCTNDSVYVLRNSDPKIHSFKKKALLSGNERFESYLRFIPHSTQICYIVTDAHLGTYIYNYDWITQIRRLVYSTKQDLGRSVDLTLSSDGKLLSWVKEVADSCLIIVRDLQTSIEKTVFSTPHFFCRYIFAEDNRSLIIGSDGHLQRIDIATGAVNIIPFKANVKSDVAAFDYHMFKIPKNTFQVKYIRDITRRPDGKQIAFTALKHVYVMDLPNGVPRRLNDQLLSQAAPAYSPDGQSICYAAWSDISGGTIWVASVFGGSPNKLLEQPKYAFYSPTWSADGKKIIVGKVHADSIYTVRNPGKLLIINMEDQTVSTFPGKSVFNSALQLSPDGKDVFYTMENESKKQMRMSLMEQTDINTSVINKFSSASFDFLELSVGIAPSNISISPDGKNMAYCYEDHICLLPLTQLKDTANFSESSIRFASGVDPHWEDDGHMLGYVFDHKYYRIDPQRVINEAKKRTDLDKINKIPGKGEQIIHIRPDQIIPIKLSETIAKGAGTIVFTNAKIITMDHQGVISKGMIVVKDGVIKYIGKNRKTFIHGRAKIWDMSGKTIMPGLIDVHYHKGESIVPYFWQIRSYMGDLAYGITSIRDPSSDLPSYGYAEAIQDGEIIGPRLFTSGTAVREMYHINNLSIAKDIVDQRKAYGGTFIKQYILPNRQDRQWLLKASEQAGMNMTNEGDWVFLNELMMAKDGSTGMEHLYPFRESEIRKDIITFLGKTKTFFTPTLQATFAQKWGFKSYSKYLFEQYPDKKFDLFTTPQQKKTNFQFLAPKPLSARDTLGYFEGLRIVAKLYHAGERITMGSHGDIGGLGAHIELWLLKKGGLTNMETLQSATILAAEEIGVQKDIGSLKAGKIADLLVLNSDPLKDIHNTKDIKYVMKQGVLFDGDTVDEIWPVRKPSYKWWVATPINQQQN